MATSRDTGSSNRLARSRAEVAGAILLVARGRFPEITISNLPQCRGIALELSDEATQRGVDLVVDAHDDGRADGLRIRRR
jgi:hypothetical protein